MRTELETEYEELLRRSWRTQSELLVDPAIGPWLLPYATPILAFGQWQTAQIATAGLNPSEREFCDEEGREFGQRKRRFLHRMSGGDGELSPAGLRQARRHAEGYFELGNAYWLWFKGFESVLDELGWTFAEGNACHTDYLSPFATGKGWGNVPVAVRQRLQAEGLPLWKDCLELMPRLRVILGIGAGWKVMPSVFGFEQWDAIPTPFDSKGGEASISRPYLLHKASHLNGRPIDLFWWKPNRGEPMTWLDEAEKRRLAAVMRKRSRHLSL